jgi:OOP family OmpA-OmpF porin
MKNKERCGGIFGLLLALSLAAAPAAAQDAGFYLGGSLGTGDAKNTCNGVAGQCDDNDTAYKLFGGYQMNRNFAWELAYGYLGDHGTTSAERTSKAVDFSGVVALPLNERFALLGRLGVYRSQVEVHPGGASAHNTAFTWGLGMRFNLWRFLAVRAEWQVYNDIGNDATGKDDIDLLTLGIVMPL